MNPEAPVGGEDTETVIQTSRFLKTLVSIIRAADSHGAWDRRSNAALLAEFVVDKAARRALPMIGDPDPEVIQRVEQFYRAVALRVEERTGLPASPLMTMSHEGFGRLVVTTGKLVVFAKTLRDVHRFGFDSLQALEREGETVVVRAVEAIETYPAVARA